MDVIAYALANKKIKAVTTGIKNVSYDDSNQRLVFVTNNNVKFYVNIPGLTTGITNIAIDGDIGVVTATKADGTTVEWQGIPTAETTSYIKADNSVTTVQRMLRELETTGGKAGASISVKGSPIYEDENKRVKVVLTDGTTEWPVYIPYGKDGVDGQDGKDGIDGKDGLDGTSISVVSNIKNNGVTTLILTDGTQNYTIEIADGKNGQNGQDGENGIDGQNGYSVKFVSCNRNAENNGSELVLLDEATSQNITIMIPDGAAGEAGAPGENGIDGKDGKDGKSISIKSNVKQDGITTVVLTDGENDEILNIADGTSLSIINTERIDTNNDTKEDATKITFSDGTIITIPDGADGATGDGAGDMLAADYDADGSIKAAKGIKAYIDSILTNYVLRDGSKQLSTEDFTSELKTKLENIDLTQYVLAEEGKGLSTEDFTTDLKEKLENITFDPTKTYLTDQDVDGTTIQIDENGKLKALAEGRVKDVKVDTVSIVDANGEAILYSPKIKLSDTTTINSVDGIIDLSDQSFVNGSGEENVINIVKMNGTALEIDSTDKSVNIDTTGYDTQINSINQNIEAIQSDNELIWEALNEDYEAIQKMITAEDLKDYVKNDTDYQTVRNNAGIIRTDGEADKFLNQQGSYVALPDSIGDVIVKNGDVSTSVIDANGHTATIDLSNFVENDQVIDAIQDTDNTIFDRITSVKAVIDYVAEKNKFIGDNGSITSTKVGSLNIGTDIAGYSWQAILQLMLFGVTAPKELVSADVSNTTLDLAAHKITFNLPVGDGIASITANSNIKSYITAPGLNIDNVTIDASGKVTIALESIDNLKNGTYTVQFAPGAFTAEGDGTVNDGETQSGEIVISFTINNAETPVPTITSSYDSKTKIITVNVTNANGTGYTTDISGFVCSPMTHVTSIDKSKLPIKIQLGELNGSETFTFNGIKNIGDNIVSMGTQTMSAYTTTITHTLYTLSKPTVKLTADDSARKVSISIVNPADYNRSYATSATDISKITVTASDGTDVTSSCNISASLVDCSTLAGGTYTVNVSAGFCTYTINDPNHIYYSSSATNQASDAVSTQIIIPTASVEEAYWNQFGNVVAHSTKEEGPAQELKGTVDYISPFIQDELKIYGYDAMDKMAEEGKYEMYYIGCPENNEDFGNKYYIPYANYYAFDTDPRINVDALHNLHNNGIFSSSYDEIYWYFDEKGRVDVVGAMALDNSLHFRYVIVRLA